MLRCVKRLVYLAAAGFLTVSAFVLGATLYFAMSWPDPAHLPRTDVIIVLSAGVYPDGTADVRSTARTETGIALWRAGVAPRMIFSGGIDPRNGQVYSQGMARVAAEAGVEQSAVLLEARAVSTFENARFSIPLTRQNRWRRVTLVTDDYHLARAAALFWFWNRGDAVEIVSLVPSDGLWRSSPRSAAWALVREVLAYPFNAAKVVGQIGLDAIGRGDDRVIR